MSLLACDYLIKLFCIYQPGDVQGKREAALKRTDLKKGLQKSEGRLLSDSSLASRQTTRRWVKNANDSPVLISPECYASLTPLLPKPLTMGKPL